MKHDVSKDMGFFAEMSERQISVREFFGNVLLDSIRKYYGLSNVLILCYDTDNHFLSWTDRNGIRIDDESHPYRKFAADNVIGDIIYQEAVRDRLDYFNIEPRLYWATDYIPSAAYGTSPYVRFLEEHFQAHYSVTMAFGINAYIQIVFFKSAGEGDFTEMEIQNLNHIYVSIANSYRGFKKYEQRKIVSNIQDEIILSGEKAYLVTDDFMHILSYNQMAANYLKHILGRDAELSAGGGKPCIWLPFLLDGEANSADSVVMRVIKDYVFKIYTYDQKYSHGIVDRYHWITISKKEGREGKDNAQKQLCLTQAEWKVAELLHRGLTYRAIANELFVSYHTVKKHIENIYAKCGVKSRFELHHLFDEMDSWQRGGKQGL